MIEQKSKKKRNPKQEYKKANTPHLVGRSSGQTDVLNLIAQEIQGLTNYQKNRYRRKRQKELVWVGSSVIAPWPQQMRQCERKEQKINHAINE